MGYELSGGTEAVEKLYDLRQLGELLGGNNEFLSSLAGIYLNTVPLNSKTDDTGFNKRRLDYGIKTCS